MAARPKHRTRRITIVALLTVLAFFLLIVADYLSFLSKCRTTPTVQKTSEPQKEAIVVLTGDRNRISAALQLLRERESPLLIISGIPTGIPLTDIIQKQQGASYLIHETWEKIIVESESSTTLENARQTKEIIKGKPIQNLILVTSDYHMPRALLVFKRILPEMEIHAWPVPSQFGLKAFREYWKYRGYLILGFLSPTA